MGTRIKIMDLEIDLLTEETFESLVSEYLTNDYLNIVHLISLDYIDTYDENELVQETLQQADIVLPGEKAILTSYHVDVLETGGMVVNYRSAEAILKKEPLKNKKFYLVTNSEKEAKILYKYIATHFEGAEIVGVYAADGTVSEEALVNDINTTIPDIVVLTMESTGAEEWLHQNRTRINAKLCLALGSMVNMIIRENVHVPTWMKKLHLGKIFTALVRLPYSTGRRKKVFWKKMDKYNQKKMD